MEGYTAATDDILPPPKVDPENMRDKYVLGEEQTLIYLRFMFAEPVRLGISQVNLPFFF